MPNGLPDIPDAPEGSRALVRQSAWDTLREASRRIVKVPTAVSRPGGAMDQPGMATGPIIARWLTAGPGPAAWRQVVRSGGDWVDGGRSGTIEADPAWEANGEDIEEGTVVTLRRVPPGGDWIAFQPECFSCRPTITVRLCDGTAVPGASVTIDGRTRTTDASGNARFGIPGPGVYTIRVEKSPYPTYEGEHEIDCDGTVEIRLSDKPLKVTIGAGGCTPRRDMGAYLDNILFVLERGTFVLGAEEATWAPDGGCVLTKVANGSCVEFDLNRPGCGPREAVGTHPVYGTTIWRGYRATISKDRFQTAYLYLLPQCGDNDTCGG